MLTISQTPIIDEMEYKQREHEIILRDRKRDDANLSSKDNVDNIPDVRERKD